MTLLDQVDCEADENSSGAIPEISIALSNGEEDCHWHEAFVRRSLTKLLPGDFVYGSSEEDTDRDQAQYLKELLPIFTWDGNLQVPGNISFYVLCTNQEHSVKFLLDMLSRWLVPGVRLNMVLLHALDFEIPAYGKGSYSVVQITVHVVSEKDLGVLRQTLPAIETEICLGLQSSYSATRILEIKGLSSDEKTALVQEQIVRLRRRRPETFDSDVITEMQHFLVMCRDDFKAIRDWRQMSRIICFHYLFRKSLRASVASQPGRRHLSLKIARTRLQPPEGPKTVLALLVAVNFLGENEFFEERHLLKAVQNYLPHVKAVPKSFLSHLGRSDRICTLYVELEKEGGAEFAQEEIRTLRQNLPADLRDRIEHLVHPIFMPRNEEEIMRNILTLGNQLKYLRDIPQVIITFDEQQSQHVQFNVILLRVCKPDTKPLEEAFKEAKTSLEYFPDRVKQVGLVRKKYPKEATVFRVRLPKKRFLRLDHSLDLNRARQVVFQELTRVVGDCRDYNGGMISKQHEQFSALRELLPPRERHHEFLLENFFYSLSPAVMRNILEPGPLKKLFTMLLEVVDEGFFQKACYSYLKDDDGVFAYAMISTEESGLRDRIEKDLEGLGFTQFSLAQSLVNAYGTPCLGYLFRYENEEQKRLFFKVLEVHL